MHYWHYSNNSLAITSSDIWTLIIYLLSIHLLLHHILIIFRPFRAKLENMEKSCHCPQQQVTHPQKDPDLRLLLVTQHSGLSLIILVRLWWCYSRHKAPAELSGTWQSAIADLSYIWAIDLKKGFDSVSHVGYPLRHSGVLQWSPNLFNFSAGDEGRIVLGYILPVAAKSAFSSGFGHK